MNNSSAVKILCDNYSPGELEERLGLTLEDVAEGLEVYVDDNWEEVEEMLKEDLWV